METVVIRSAAEELQHLPWKWFLRDELDGRRTGYLLGLSRLQKAIYRSGAAPIAREQANKRNGSSVPSGCLATVGGTIEDICGLMEVTIGLVRYPEDVTYGPAENVARTVVITKLRLPLQPEKHEEFILPSN